jgi:hypothetical protein
LQEATLVQGIGFVNWRLNPGSAGRMIDRAVVHPERSVEYQFPNGL